MDRTHRRLVKYRIAGLPTELVSAIDVRLEEYGIPPRDRERMIAGANILPTDSVESGALKAMGEGEHLSPEDASGAIPMGPRGPIGPQVEHIDTVRARWERELQTRGMSKAEAEQVVRRAKLTNPAESPEEAWSRLVDAADRLGNPIPGVPQPTVEPDVFRDEWTNFLTMRGLNRPTAERLVRNTRFAPNETPEQSWDRITEQARVSRIKLPPRTLAEAEQTPDLTSPLDIQPSRAAQAADSPAGQAVTTAGRSLADGFEHLADFMAGAPTPGGVAGPLTAMILLWFAFIPMLYMGGKAYTRLHLLFLSTIGDAELDDPNPPDKDIPLGDIAQIAIGISDTAQAIENAGEMIGDAAKLVEHPISSAEKAAQAVARGIENKAKNIGNDLLPGNPFGSGGPLPRGYEGTGHG